MNFILGRPVAQPVFFRFLLSLLSSSFFFLLPHARDGDKSRLLSFGGLLKTFVFVKNFISLFMSFFIRISVVGFKDLIS